MSTLYYDPSEVKSWATKIIDYLVGDTASIKACSTSFTNQINKLTSGMWTGAAARQNYLNFLETHKTLINFVNVFGRTFQDAMTRSNEAMANLEIANLGSSTNISSAFGTLDYAAMQEASETTIPENPTRYDYFAIIEVGQELAKIDNTLEDVYKRLLAKIRLIGDNQEVIWAGDAADAARTSLINVLEKYIPAIKEQLGICINNIKTAAEQAKVADSGSTTSSGSVGGSF